MKKTKIVIPALGLLLLSTAASVTGTVAWFSSSTAVTVSGMNVTTKVSGNLLIAESNSSDDNYSAAPLTQNIAGILEPSSTVNASSFFYTVDKVKGTGQYTEVVDNEHPENNKHSDFYAYSESTALANTAAGKTNYDAAFVAAYGVNDTVTTSNVMYAYVDYNFYVKATTAANDQDIVLSKINLLYNGNTLGASDTAWRVGVFANEVAENNTTTAADTLKTIVAPSGAAYWDGKAVSAVDGSTHQATFTAISDPAVGADAIIGNIATKGQTKRFRVLVRLWLEGNDQKCNNDTYALLSEQYALSLKVELNGTAATAITSATGAL